MTSDILLFEPKAKPEEPTLRGPAHCLDCKHRWEAVSPVGETWLECPNCHAHKGRRLGNVSKAGMHWHCHCGNDLFHMTPAGMYCPLCGCDQEGY